MPDERPVLPNGARDRGKILTQDVSTPLAGCPPSAGLDRIPPPAMKPGRFGRHEMIRKSLFILAASFMTLSAFSGTLAIMCVNTGAQVQVA